MQITQKVFKSRSSLMSFSSISSKTGKRQIQIQIYFSVFFASTFITIQPENFSKSMWSYHMLFDREISSSRSVLCLHNRSILILFRFLFNSVFSSIKTFSKYHHLHLISSKFHFYSMVFPKKTKGIIKHTLH